MFLKALCAVSLALFTLPASAALYDRGDGMIYDDTLDITWLQDANYAATQYQETGGLDGDADGLMDWLDAVTWANGLSYGGYDNWRLASVGDPPLTGFITIGELGHMFYNNLGNAAETSMLNNVNFTDASPGGGTVSFLNVQEPPYWLNEEHPLSYIGAWAFYPSGGYQGTMPEVFENYAWAVRPGDVSAVPVPAAAWLFGSALMGLAGAKRNRVSANTRLTKKRVLQ